MEEMVVMISALDVGRTAALTGLGVEVVDGDRAGQSAGPQRRVDGQQPPPRDSGQDWKAEEHVRATGMMGTGEEVVGGGDEEDFVVVVVVVVMEEAEVVATVNAVDAVGVLLDGEEKLVGRAAVPTGMMTTVDVDMRTPVEK